MQRFIGTGGIGAKGIASREGESGTGNQFHNELPNSAIVDACFRLIVDLIRRHRGCAGEARKR
jgi:hypothetical protein